MSDDPDFEMPEPTKLALFGDWHGAGHWGGNMIRHAKRSGCDAIVHLGDWGFYPDTEGNCIYTQHMHNLCKQQGIPLYWIDGNHENHDALVPGQGDKWLRHLPRGHRWQWWGKTWMSVGGGVSVNRKDLTPGKDYFPEEVLTYQQLDHVLRPGDVDIVIAHDTPTGVDIPGVHYQLKHDQTIWPPEDIRSSWNHRDIMAEICKDKHPDWWFHGHYHVRYNGEWIGLDPLMGPLPRKTQVVGLDCQRGPFEHNIVVLTPEELGLELSV